MSVALKTTIGVAKPYGRRLKKELAYPLSLNKLSLISSLKSVIKTEASSMVKIRKSIMDSLYVESSHTPNLITKKKAQSFKEKLSCPHTRLLKPFLSTLALMDRVIIAKKYLKEKR